MVTISRESIISSPSRDYAYNLLWGNSSQYDQPWSRYQWINTIIVKLKEAYRNWSLDRKFTQVIRSLERKSGEERAVSELFTFVTEEVKGSIKAESLGLRAASILITYEEMRGKIQKQCPQFLGDFQHHYDQYILKYPHQLSMQAKSASEVFGGWDSICRRAATCTKLTSHDIAIALGTRFKPEELSERHTIKNAEVLRNEMAERALAKISQLMQDPGDKPIDQKRLSDLLGEDMDCLDPQYVDELVVALRKIQMHPHNLIREQEARAAYLKANEDHQVAWTATKKYTITTTEKAFANLIEEMVIDPLTEAIYRDGDISSAYYAFIDDLPAFARQIQSSSSKEEIKKAVRDHLSWPGLLDRFYETVESHALFCLREMSSKQELIQSLSKHPTVLANGINIIEFGEDLWKLKSRCDQENISAYIRDCVRKYVKSPHNRLKSAQNIVASGLTVEELKERLSSLEQAKKDIIDSCQSFTALSSITEGETLRDQLIEKYGALSGKLAQLEGSVISGKVQQSKISASIQGIETELASISADLKALKKWILLQGEIEVVQAVFDTFQKPKDITLEELYSLASLGADPVSIAAKLGQSWHPEVVEELDKVFTSFIECQERLMQAEEDYLRATCRALDGNPLISRTPVTLSDYQSSPQKYLKALTISVLIQDSGEFEKRVANRREEEAKKVMRIVMQNVIDKAANSIPVEEAWSKVTAKELFGLQIKIARQEPLSGDDAALLLHMRSHVREFDLTEKEMEAIEKSMASSSPEWSPATIDAYVKFLTQYHSRVLNAYT